MRAVVFRDPDGKHWVGQCIEHDIAAQSYTALGVKDELEKLADDYRKLSRYGLRRVPRPPLSAVYGLRPGKHLIRFN